MKIQGSDQRYPNRQEVRRFGSQCCTQNNALTTSKLAFLSMVLASSGAFSPTLSPLRTNQLCISKSTLRQARHNEISAKAMTNLLKKDRLPFESEADIGDGVSVHAGDPARQSWLGWMQAGKPRGVAEVKMREAAELGGLPRNYRYSSR